MNPHANGLRAHRPATRGQQIVAFVIFVAGYFLLGMAGLQLQSVQTGVTPLWPASGFALAMVYWFGLRQLVALQPLVLTRFAQDLPEASRYDHQRGERRDRGQNGESDRNRNLAGAGDRRLRSFKA